MRDVPPRSGLDLLAILIVHLALAGCERSTPTDEHEPEAEVIRGAIDPDADFDAFFAAWKIRCDENATDPSAALERCRQARVARDEIEEEALRGELDRWTMDDYHTAEFDYREACAPRISEWSPGSRAYPSVLCWVARSPEPLGYLASPRPYPPGLDWWETERPSNPYPWYDEKQHALGVNLSMDWGQVEGGEFVLGISATNFRGVPSRTETLFFSDPCLAEFVDKVDLESFSGPARPMRAMVRVDAVPDLDTCPGVEHILLMNNAPTVGH